jgi:hypothetical protein
MMNHLRRQNAFFGLSAKVLQLQAMITDQTYYPELALQWGTSLDVTSKTLKVITQRGI